MKPDCELLRQYAEHGDDAAFAEVVRRHVNLIFASAVRLLNGNAAMAQDVTQVVFTDLARKAGGLIEHPSVAGWLHTSVRFAAANAVRREQRRRLREQQAGTMYDQTNAHEFDWLQLRPWIDEAVGQLHEPERNAVLLRFFEEKSHREVGIALGVTENAARMRVERGLEKLRVHLARHGITASVVLLAATLSTRAASAPAPTAFAATVAGKALLGAALPVGGVTFAKVALRPFWATKAPLAFAGSVVFVSAAALYFILPNTWAGRLAKPAPAATLFAPTLALSSVITEAHTKLAVAPDVLTAASALAAVGTKFIATAGANTTAHLLDQAAQDATKPLTDTNSDTAPPGATPDSSQTTPIADAPTPNPEAQPAPNIASDIAQAAPVVAAALPLVPPTPNRNGVITQWSLRVGGNGHYYLPIASPHGISWTAAQAYAVQRGGHLATIATREENNFVFSLVNAPEFWRSNPASTALLGPWLGGIHWAQAMDMNYGWRWINNGGSIAYANWAAFEPRVTGNYLHFFAWGDSRVPTWDNDPAQGLMPGFVVEFDTKPRLSASMADTHQPSNPAQAQNPIPSVPRGTIPPYQRREVSVQPVAPPFIPSQSLPGRRVNPPIIPVRIQAPLALSSFPAQPTH